eukprot:CAMPEP_0184336780 /NCGR_PEP_ID=MMETSP1089-20130417/4976_1 /TAXON_ID=38269 ORGANISM="Gloeochaete wittrockiana, Strain SAG46.84" /NCGR_SAMPLE_ID=MMETSP1089 /ASSEMBLY_ACC=CAM_ASM_000445 /LENGTH=337 /DNA_ID=CAMNT_0026661901 /DNA_START=86 /DNA_END=1099 /DNA_ORIENTATION=-
MRLTVTTEDGEQMETIDVDSGQQIEDIRAIVEAMLGVPMTEQMLLFEGRILPMVGRVGSFGLKENDLILVRRSSVAPAPNPAPAPAAQHNPGLNQAAGVIQQILSDPNLLAQVRATNPRLADAVVAGDVNRVNELVNERRNQELERMRRIQAMEADPFNPENQALIEEEIRMSNVNQNMETALEHAPESFGTVVMLYIDVVVNGVPVKAFVDSGAQATIMSQQCAERCNLNRLVDKRFAGIARGVGTSKIIGRVHVAPIEIGGSYFPCTFTVLENQDMEFLLGLDMLKRHQCCIDLKSHCLRIGQEDLVVPFLSEKDIPKHLRDAEESSGSQSQKPH